MRVLVLDAEQKSALASVRSLGERGMTVLTGSSRTVTRGSLSRHSERRVRLPALADEQAFINALVAQLDALRIDVVLPIGDGANRALSKHKERIASLSAVSVADWSSMQIASSKRETVRFAQEHGTPAPAVFSSKDEVDTFPVVVKRSLGSGRVTYANNASELARIDASDAVIQEYIPGHGYGFFALFDRGTPRAIFMHRRIREYPVTGGASTAAESVYEEELKGLGSHLLEALDWHGVAMVEFKRDCRDGSFRLMEINPKFWGSLDLSIAAGVDFPWLAVQLALGRLRGDPPSYRAGVRYQWVFDDMIHVAARPRSARAFLRDLRFAENDVSGSDPLPAVYDLSRALVTIAVGAARGRLRYPHGRVTVIPTSL
jgi:predicted ATP-grasp superfamily ATP-dependent carboligase